jgi:hypothetical protein
MLSGQTRFSCTIALYHNRVYNTKKCAFNHIKKIGYFLENFHCEHFSIILWGIGLKWRQQNKIGMIHMCLNIR